MTWLEQEPSVIEAITRALRLHEPSLLEARIPAESRVVALRAGACALGCGDEQTVDRVVRQLEPRLQAENDLLAELHWLCRCTGVLKQGMPVLRSGLLPRQLARVVSPDALFPFYPGLLLAEREEFGWSAVPLTHGGRSDRLLLEGSLDTHIHLGGTLPPLFFWVALMGGGLQFDLLRKLPAPERGHAPAEVWQASVGRAVWQRLWLAAFLEKENDSSGARIFPWLADHWWDDPRLGSRAPSADEARELAFDLDELYRLRGPEQEIEDWPFPDLLRSGRSDKNRPHYAAGERRLLYRLGQTLDRLAEVGDPSRSHLERVLRQYLESRNAFHHLLVHDRGREGLLRFIESFQRRSFMFGNRAGHGRDRRRRRAIRMVGKLERARMEASLDSQLVEPFGPDSKTTGAFEDPAVRRIEMRVSVPAVSLHRATLRAWVAGIEDHLKRGRKSQIGLIFHFIKFGNSPADETTALDDADRLEEILRHEPQLRRFIVGIDAAGKERNSNPRIFARAFFRLRRFQQEFRPEPGEPGVHLGYTYHVGEDVDDLLTGLRHIDEAVSLLLPSPEGGRLGHALALGERVRRFYDRRGTPEPGLGTHLLDLVWARGRLIERGKISWVPWLENRVQSLSRGLPGGRSPAIQECFEHMGLDRGNRGGDLSEEAGLRRDDELLEILCRGYAKARELDLPLPVPSSRPPWQKLVSYLQENLQERVARRRICVEVNPTSNLLIGDYKDYSELPYPRLVDAGIAVSLNTDDPGLFMTHLPGELAAMYEALESREKLRHREILSWLRERLFDAEQSTFLGHNVPSGRAALTLSNQWLRGD